MNGIDIVLSICLVIGLISGFRKGFIKSAFGLIGIGLAIWVGFNFSNLLETFVDEQEFIPDAFVKIVSLILTIVLVVLAVKIMSKLLHTVVHTIGLGFFNRLGGALLGLLLYLLSLSAVIYYTSPFLDKWTDQKLEEKSLIVPYLMEIATYMKISLF